MASADLLLHPVRLRVVQALLGDRVLTTGELHAELNDVPAATLYRHVAVLADAGVLEVAAERRVRGSTERSYRLATEAAALGPEEVAGMSREQHRRAFGTFVASLLADFDRWVDDDGPDGRRRPDLQRDGVGYRLLALWLDDDEFAGLVADLRRVLGERLEHGPRPGRRRRVLGTVFLPG